jgi:uncharacterized protein (DUF924 family)
MWPRTPWKEESMTRPEDILTFWFGAGAEPEERFAVWFGKDDTFDRTVRERFSATVEAAGRGELDGWAATPRGCLALVVVLDQLPRNAFRGSARAFAFDAKARAVVREGLARGDDAGLHPLEAAFFYLPLQHSEDVGDQQESVHRYEALHARAPPALQAFTASSLDYARRHQVIVERFGRFPHRNALLGRPSTPEEQEFLTQPGSSF